MNITIDMSRSELDANGSMDIGNSAACGSWPPAQRINQFTETIKKSIVAPLQICPPWPVNSLRIRLRHSR